MRIWVIWVIWWCTRDPGPEHLDHPVEQLCSRRPVYPCILRDLALVIGLFGPCPAGMGQNGHLSGQVVRSAAHRLRSGPSCTFVHDGATATAHSLQCPPIPTVAPCSEISSP